MTPVAAFRARPDGRAGLTEKLLAVPVNVGLKGVTGELMTNALDAV
jgi:hypothetical protein